MKHSIFFYHAKENLNEKTPVSLINDFKQTVIF